MNALHSEASALPPEGPVEAIPAPPEVPRVRERSAGPAWAICLPIYAAMVAILLIAHPKLDPERAHLSAVNVPLETSFDPPDYDPTERTAPGPAGGSHHLGDGAIDSRLLALPAVEIIQRAPERLESVPDLDAPQEARRVIVDKSLPLRPGGNGAPTGQDEGFGRGVGRGVGNGRGGGLPPGRLHLKHSVYPRWGTGPGEAPGDGEGVMVRLLLDARGVPLEAHPFEGRSELFPAAVRAALQWRFEVPKAYAPFAPFSVSIAFHFRKGSEAATTVREVAPVMVQ